MKYYRLYKYANNPVGAEFTYCDSDELEKTKQEFDPDKVEEITLQEYTLELTRVNRKAVRHMTGYPK